MSYEAKLNRFVEPPICEQLEQEIIVYRQMMTQIEETIRNYIRDGINVSAMKEHLNFIRNGLKDLIIQYKSHCPARFGYGSPRKAMKSRKSRKSRAKMGFCGCSAGPRSSR